MNKKNVFIVLSIIVLFGTILRFWKLGEIPLGLYQDETAIGYNAYSILQTGKDEYGRSFPLYFESFGDFKLPVYIYMTAVSERFFGLTPFAVRFPSAFFGVLTLIVFFFYVRELLKDDLVSLIATFLLAINPWHIHYTRATFEVSIVLFAFTTGIYALLLSFRKHNVISFFFGTLFFIVALYSYNLTRLLSPVLYIGFLVLEQKPLKKLNKPGFAVTALIAGIALLPFAMTLISHGGINSASGTLINSSAVIGASIREFRSYMTQNHIPFGFLFATPLLTLKQYAENVASYASVPFFFISGSGHGNHGIGVIGQFYLYELITILVGLVILIKNKFQARFILLFSAIATIAVASLTREAPHATRSFSLLLTYPILSALGLRTIYMYFKKKHLAGVLTAILSLLITYSFMYYCVAYFVRFPIAYAPSWRSEDLAVANYITTQGNKYNKVIFDTEAGYVYTSLLFYLRYSPAEFLNTVRRTPPDSEGFRQVLSFGKYEWRPVNWNTDMRQKNVLIITSKKALPDSVSSTHIFTYPKRPVVLAVKQTIIAYPVEDVAYVAVETKQ
jgi:4-amino-4-deoxy-L-arabinose transferase-like glycosyltransferase